MTNTPAGFNLVDHSDQQAVLQLSGDWVQGCAAADMGKLAAALEGRSSGELVVDGTALGRWDSTLMAFLLQCHAYCRQEQLAFSARALPEGATKLLALATAVDTHQPPRETPAPLTTHLNPLRWLALARDRVGESLAFIGELSLALARLVTGRSNTRFVDFRHFCYQAGPDAFAIISLTSVLVGMILAYLGAVQLQQFGAGLFVANLVTIGMLREMGVLMTAVVMAGRTGAAYAAQLGTMQTNEEIDAITTMGISPMEFLVLPRILALIVTMPLLTLYADLLGIIGGGLVAGGMGITPLQYISQSELSIKISHLSVGLIKSVVFAILIAVAGCRAGINSGRSSAAVGQAATEAVVTAIVYLIIADAAINIIFQQIKF
ncbi:MAG: ABC transporter permease [Pseudomonadales bacterium]|nr:ABC transporter permease [Halieaceae bacterium]MCP5189581.1 ABC transporter permease [Pseudomonadales bacterium]MCP5204815.1 ABC transporter permease [Pseudomonadales bacterium]